MEDKIELKVLGITYNPVQSGAYALLLAEVDGPYRIPIVVGLAEAQAIAMRLENIIPPRPMSHDLMVSMMHAYGISLDEVFIYKFKDGVFMSELKLNDGERHISLDSRASDAVALALRTGAPIFTTPEIVDKTGIIMETKDGENAPIAHQAHKPLEEQPIEVLQRRLAKYVEDEEYERAAEIQKIIKARTHRGESTEQGNKTSNE